MSKKQTQPDLPNHILQGREVDEIDDITKKLTEFFTESYYHPDNGDWMADDYMRIIDLSTKRDKLDQTEEGQLNRSIERLNAKYDTIQRRLGHESLSGAYNHAAQQINHINANNPDLHEVAVMQAAPAEEKAA